MLYLCIGDPHFKVSNSVETAEMVNECLRVCKEMQETKIPFIIIVLGDVLDQHEKVHIDPLTRAMSFLTSLANIAPVYVLVGNHDRVNNSDFMSDKHPFVGLEKTKLPLTIVSSTLYVGDIVLVPYVPPGRFVEALEYPLQSNKDAKDIKIPDWKKAKVIFAHQEFYGCSMGAIKSVVGDKWNTALPPVISGHIHDYQVLDEGITYVGTPIQHAFGDKSDKALLVYDTQTGESKRIRLNTTKKVMLSCNASEIDDIKIPAQGKVRLVITGEAAELKTVAKSNRVKQLIKLGVKVVYRDIPPRKNPGEKGVSYSQAQKKKFIEVYTQVLTEKKDNYLLSVFNKIITQ